MAAENKRHFRTFARNLCAALAAHCIPPSFRTASSAILRRRSTKAGTGWPESLERWQLPNGSFTALRAARPEEGFSKAIRPTTRQYHVAAEGRRERYRGQQDRRPLQGGHASRPYEHRRQCATPRPIKRSASICAKFRTARGWPSTHWSSWTTRSAGWRRTLRAARQTEILLFGFPRRRNLWVTDTLQ